MGDNCKGLLYVIEWHIKLKGNFGCSDCFLTFITTNHFFLFFSS